MMRNIIPLMAVLFISGTALGVEVCHHPPGNPANAHTINIGQPAVDAHVRLHAGDHIGACNNLPAGSDGPGFVFNLHDVLIVNSARSKGSISLVELVDNSDADHSTALKFE